MHFIAWLFALCRGCVGIIAAMPKLFLTTHDPKEYLDLLQQADLPNLEIYTEFNPECDIVFGDTGKIKKALSLLPHLKWVQTTSAGVDRLMDSSLRRDYTLTNAKNVFGESMSEYVFGYMLYFKKRIAERQRAQKAKQWDDEDGGVLRGKTLGLDRGRVNWLAHRHDSKAFQNERLGLYKGK